MYYAQVQCYIFTGKYLQLLTFALDFVEQISAQWQLDEKRTPNDHSVRAKARDDGLGGTGAAKKTLKKCDEVLMVRLAADKDEVTTEVRRVPYQLRDTSVQLQGSPQRLIRIRHEMG
jgi:hypothetical protein